MKVALITGGAGGLGRALAEEALGRGYQVALLDLDADALRSARQGLLDGQSNPEAAQRILTLSCDIRKSRECQKAVQRVVSHFGQVDLLVNNAGVSHRSLFEDTQTCVIRRTMEVNFLGAVEMTKAALPGLLSRQGSIIAISSVAGFAPLLGRTGYAASKYALRGFFETLRLELEERLHILLVYPSFIKTGLEANATDGSGQRLGAKNRKGVGAEVSSKRAAYLIFEALEKKKRSLYFPWVSRLSFLLVRLVPSLYDFFMKKSIGTEFDR